MRRAILILLFHVVCSSPMGGASKAIDAEKEADALMSNLLLQASEHTFDQFITDCMWDQKYRAMDSDRREKIVRALKVKLADHLLRKSLQEWKNLMGDACTDTYRSPDHPDSSSGGVLDTFDGFVILSGPDNASGSKTFSPNGYDYSDDF